MVVVVVDPWSRRRARPKSTRTGTHVDDEDERERERCKKCERSKAII
jgi:hypothetical protein